MPLQRKKNSNSERKILAVSFFLIGIVLILESLGFLMILQILMSEFTLSSGVAWVLWIYAFIKIMAGIVSLGFGMLLFWKK